MLFRKCKKTWYEQNLQPQILQLKQLLHVHKAWVQKNKIVHVHIAFLHCASVLSTMYTRKGESIYACTKYVYRIDCIPRRSWLQGSPIKWTIIIARYRSHLVTKSWSTSIIPCTGVISVCDCCFVHRKMQCIIPHVQGITE